jgi:membrane protease YdiL (CAAX protease family)
LTLRRVLPSDPADFLRSIVPLALLGLAAVEGSARLAVLLVLVVGTYVATSRNAPVRWAWAAAVPVALALVWGGLTSPTIATEGSSCTDPASPVAALRALEAIVVLAAVAGLALWLKANAGTLGLRMPARRWIRWAIIGFVVAGPVALLAGPYLARPFFGDVGYDLVPAALVPALIFAISNGVSEEVAYRGALLHWSARVMGTGPALLGQGIVFGLAHSGSDVIGGAIPLMIALGVGGLVAGVIALRTRSLLIPIAVHIGLDLPIYFAFACPN